MIIIAIIALVPAAIFAVLFFIPEDSCGPAPTNGMIATLGAFLCEAIVAFLCFVIAIQYAKGTDGARGNAVLSLNYIGVIIAGILMVIAAAIHLTFGTCAKDVRDGSSDIGGDNSGKV